MSDQIIFKRLESYEFAIAEYEKALHSAFPKGATGDVFHHWNAARKYGGRPFLSYEQKERSNDSAVPTLDVQSTIAMWQEAYQRLDAKLDELETLTKRLSLDLECVLLNRDKWWDQAHETLQAYRDLMDAWYPQETVSPLGKD